MEMTIENQLLATRQFSKHNINNGERVLGCNNNCKLLAKTIPDKQRLSAGVSAQTKTDNISNNDNTD